MRPELIYEALLFFTRDELDVFHMIARFVHQMIGYSNALALRPAHAVFVGCGLYVTHNGTDVEVFLTEGDIQPHFKEQLSPETFELIHWRLNNCFFDTAYVTFFLRAFLQYWLPRTTSRAGVFEFEEFAAAPNAVDVDMMDLAMSRLRPTLFDVGEVDATTWIAEGGLNSDFLALLDRPSLQGTVQTCKLRVSNSFP